MKTSVLVLLALSCNYALAQNSLRKFNVSAYQNIKISKALAANIQPGEYALTASGIEKDLDQLVVEVKDNTLYIDLKKNINYAKDTVVGKTHIKNSINTTYASAKEIKLNIQLPNPNKIELNEASKAYFSGFGKLQQLSLLLGQASQFKGDLEIDKLNVECSSASSFTAKLNAQQFNISLLGASSAYVSGLSKQLDAKILGASSLEATKLQVSDIFLNASGASKADVWATQNLNVNANAASEVLYKGTAKLNAESTGASEIRKK